MFKWLKKLARSGLNEKVRFNERVVVVVRNTKTGKKIHIDTGTIVYKLKNLFK